MKVKNKYNNGDIVWIGKDSPCCHRIKAIEIFVHPEKGIMVFYALEGTPPGTCALSEDVCFSSKEECVNRVNYKKTKAIRMRSNKAIVRICLVLAASIIVFPFCFAQAIYWIFTGRKEPSTHQIMNKIKNMLCNDKA